MARSSTFAAAKIHDGLMLTRVAGILALGLAVMLEALVVTPFCPSSQALLAPLLLAAVVQIGAGLNEWRHERILESVVLVAFGLFTCAQISQLSNSATTGSSLAQGGFLLFWGSFAALVAAQASDCGRSFHLLLAAVAASLLLKALVLVLSWLTLWPLLLLAGVVTFALAILAGLRYLPALHS